MSSEPLTDEQHWGVPAETAIKKQPEDEDRTAADYCPYKEIRCLAWDHGCQAEICIAEIENEGND